MAVGADEGNILALVGLAQQGVAGRCEANRLLWQWTKPVSPGTMGYVSGPAIYQAMIRKARQIVDAPPRCSKDWEAWEPGHALGPYWILKQEFMGPGAPPPPPAFGQPWTPLAAPATAATGSGQNPWANFTPGGVQPAATGAAPAAGGGQVTWVPGTPFVMSIIDPVSGRWGTGWWQNASGEWLYRSYS